MSDARGFDYEAATWGHETIDPRGHSLAAYRLREALAHTPARGRLLEIGCGAGRFLRAAAALRPGLEIVGIDVSASALEAAHRGCPRAELRRATPMEPLPAGDGEFDAVWVLDVLEHVPDPERLLAEVRRVLAPGGVFHLNVPCEGDACCLWRWLPGQAGERGLKRRFAGHLWRFRRREVLDSLRAAGFAPVRTRHSLHALGNLADVAAFVAIALRARARPGASPPTTGDLLTHAEGGNSASASGTRPAVSRARRLDALGRLVRATDAALELEARCLARIPSWGLHVSVRVDPPA